MTAVCAWAACHKPATAIAGDWPMCRPHLVAHHAFEDEARAPTERLEHDEQIRLLWRQGLTDKEISMQVGSTPERVHGRRRVMNLTHRARAACGTRSGYERHRQNSETPCEACREVRRVYDQKRYAARKAA